MTGETWIKASFFDSLRDPRPLSVGIMLERFGQDVAPHHGPKDALPLVSFATYPGGATRGLKGLETVTALAFDVDEPAPSVDAFAARLAGALDLAWFVHTSFSSAPGALRFRVVAPISRPMLPDEHRAIWPVLADVLARGGVKVDAACKDPSRAYFAPAVPPSGVYQHRAIPGERLDVDLWLSDAHEAERAAAEAHAFEREAAARRPSSTRGLGLSAVERASRYLATMPPSISGARGHDALFRAALALHGFGLPESEALAMLRAEFNPRCEPAWSEREIARKVSQVARSRFPSGYLLERRAS